MAEDRTWFWAWGGECFGYKEGDNLWTYDGRHVGKFRGDEVYASDGRYLGEIRNNNRLISNTSKKSKLGGIFAPYANRVAFVRYINYVGYVMYAGYEDFPGPDKI